MSETPARRRPRRASSDRREDVLAAARQLFAAKGFHATGTRELAAAADVNDALLYRYFPNKEAILTALVDQAIAAFAALPATLAGTLSEDPDAVELLETLGVAFVGIATEQLDLLTILISEHQTLADDRRFVQFIHVAATGLGLRLEQLTGYKDGYLTARAYMGSLVAFVLLQNVLGLSSVHQVDAEAFVRHLAKVTAAGLSSIG